MQDSKPEAAEAVPVATSGAMKALEFVFLLLLLVAVAGAFVAALTYDFISARAPLFIMLPLLVLIGVQFNRARKKIRFSEVITECKSLVSSMPERFRSTLSLIGWMLFLLAIIYVAGQYVGMMVFMFTLMYFSAREPLRLSLLVTVIVTASIYGLFEHVFSIELYRGLVANLLANYG